MRLSLCLLLFTFFCTVNAQCFFDPSTGLFLDLSGAPCFTNNYPVAASFLGFGQDDFSQSVNQIRVVAPELDAIVNSDQNPSLLHQPKAYQSIQLDYAPWQTNVVFSNPQSALKVSIHKQFRRGGSWSLRYENFNQPSVLRQPTSFLSRNLSNNQLFRLAYAKPLSERWSMGFAAKYIRSIPSDSEFFSLFAPRISSIAIDIGFKYQRTLIKSPGQEIRWQWGGSLANLGPRIQSVSPSNVRLPLPTTLSTGVLLEQITQLAGTASLRISGMYQINKLLVPRLCRSCDGNLNGIPDYLDYGMLGGILASFADSPQGLRGEWQEINHQFDMSAFYRFSEKFGIRQKFTLFYQHPNNGYIQYIAAELGFQWKRLQLDINYLHPNATRIQVASKRIGFRLGYWWG